MIVTPFFTFASILDHDSKADSFNRNCGSGRPHFSDLACKYYEFFQLWYVYVRHFCPHEHIYIVDCGSPLPIEPILEKIPENFEIITDEKSFSLDLSKTIHVKKYKNALPHGNGAGRTAVDCISSCYYNKTAHTLIESDVLLAYNWFEDFRDRDWVTPGFGGDGGIKDAALSHITYPTISRKINQEWIDYHISNISNLIFREGDFTRTFKGGSKLGLISQPGKYVHKTDILTLRNFILNNKINHPYVDEFLNKLDAQILLRNRK